MRCPGCGEELARVRASDVEVDACAKGCGGMWFDQLELRKLARDDAPPVSALLASVANRGPFATTPDTRRRCTRCDVPLMKRRYPSRADVRIDECPQCAGTFLDYGELNRLLSDRRSRAEPAVDLPLIPAAMRTPGHRARRTLVAMNRIALVFALSFVALLVAAAVVVFRVLGDLPW